jgi:DNA polymerase-1
MTNTLNYPSGIWCVDFEFHPTDRREGNLPSPVCMVAIEACTQKRITLWRDELCTLTESPFPIGEDALFVAYYAPAEFGCFLALGWGKPVNILDVFVEFRCLTNGLPLPAGKGLIGALCHYQLPTLAVQAKETMREIILRGAPWTEQEKNDIVAYCGDDVEGLTQLLSKMLPDINFPQALFRGEYSWAAAVIERNGVPLDGDACTRLLKYFPAIQNNLINAVNPEYDVYESGTFQQTKFAAYLEKHAISWPRTETGQLRLDDDTFKDMSRIYPQLSTLHELRKTIGKMRLIQLSVGDDGRNRCMLSIFRAKTGRNQPSNTKGIFGTAAWLRSLVKPVEGYGLAYIDWSQQEFGIAAALSQDPAMQEAYISGDPYLAFAKLAGAVPAEATKDSHTTVRDQFKQCALAVLYGMGAESLAMRSNQSTAQARHLLELHRRTFCVFWAWLDRVVTHAQLQGYLYTAFGWGFHCFGVGERTLQNFLMQANGSEMLRLACVLMVQRGIKICTPVHDAVLIEAPITALEETANAAQECMREASMAVLGGFSLNSDVKYVRHPECYMDKRGESMWQKITGLLNELGNPTC